MLPLYLLFALAGDAIDAFGGKWKAPVGREWSYRNGELSMLVARPQEASPRYPVQYALLEGEVFESFTLECEVKREGGSLILVYNWQDSAHFNYVHLSVDSPEKQIVHNGVFHVYGSDRSRISKGVGPGSLPTREWTKVRLDYDARSGKMTATVGGEKYVSLEAVDVSLTRGQVGLGSFFETAQFRNFQVRRRD
ncbi:MAG: DUF1080 domain-containing protein [Bryobacter sp.]|jgi:hypothetical protein|nr:DUF1080 domain-containing protein [Bryobacter sp. CoA8 C33]